MPKLHEVEQQDQQSRYRGQQARPQQGRQVAKGAGAKTQGLCNGRTGKKEDALIAAEELARRPQHEELFGRCHALDGGERRLERGGI